MPISSSDAPLPDAHLRTALAYWQRKCGERHMPRRADIDPVEMPDLLPYVRLVDVVAPGQYRYRVLFLPLSEDGETVSTVLVIQHFVAGETGTMDAFDPWATHYVEIQRRVL